MTRYYVNKYKYAMTYLYLTHQTKMQRNPFERTNNIGILHFSERSSVIFWRLEGDNLIKIIYSYSTRKEHAHQIRIQYAKIHYVSEYVAFMISTSFDITVCLNSSHEIWVWGYVWEDYFIIQPFSLLFWSLYPLSSNKKKGGIYLFLADIKLLKKNITVTTWWDAAST